MERIKLELIRRLDAEKKPEQAKILSGFFKTGKGEYGEGDSFWGIKVPVQRAIAKHYYKLLPIRAFGDLLSHGVHEVRLTALMMMVYRYEKSNDDTEKQALVKVYLENKSRINNWDLVDVSAPNIVGAWYYQKDHSDLIKLAESGHLWSQRIAMLATFYFIKRDDFDTAFRIAEILLDHKHDLIHKAVGWMLREIGNRNYAAEYDFLKKHYQTMPRTMLRYAIEKFKEPVRQDFLKGNI